MAFSAAGAYGDNCSVGAEVASDSIVGWEEATALQVGSRSRTLTMCLLGNHSAQRYRDGIPRRLMDRERPNWVQQLVSVRE